MASQIMRWVVIDIETIAPRWVEGGHGWKPDTFAPLPYHEPVVIAWLKVQSDGLRVTHRLEAHTMEGPDSRAYEQTVLNQLREAILKADMVVTFNGRGFDMPLLALRAMALGVDWSFWSDWRHRFPNYKQPLRHVDLADQLTDYGAGTRFGLHALTTMLGLPGKDGIDGSEVARVWAEGPAGQASVRDYCCRDVVDTWACYLMWSQSSWGKAWPFPFNVFGLFGQWVCETSKDLGKRYEGWPVPSM